MERYYKIAGLIVKMDSSGRTYQQSMPYQFDEYEQVDIEIHPNLEEARLRFPLLSENECEYMATGRNFYQQLIYFEGMRIHASAVAMNGKAYLFSADCGTGKSTHVSLWRKVFGDEQVRVLNDDKPAIRLENGTWYTYGTPWSGKTGQNLNLRVPLAGIALLERGEKNEIEKCDRKKALHMFFKQMITLNTIEDRVKHMELVDKLMQQIPIWHLKCNMESEAAIISYETMSGIRKVEQNEG